MITLTTGLLIAIVVPIYVVIFAFIKQDYWDHGVITRKLDPEKEKLKRIKQYGYDPLSPTVKRFQRLAGITYQGGRYGSCNSLRDRFDRLRICETNNYVKDFNLANMVEDIYIPIRNK